MWSVWGDPEQELNCPLSIKLSRCFLRLQRAYNSETLRRTLNECFSLESQCLYERAAGTTLQKLQELPDRFRREVTNAGGIAPFRALIINIFFLLFETITYLAYIPFPFLVSVVIVGESPTVNVYHDCFSFCLPREHNGEIVSVMAHITFHSSDFFTVSIFGRVV